MIVIVIVKEFHPRALVVVVVVVDLALGVTRNCMCYY